MTENEMLSRLLQIFPDATLGEDSDGQLVIFTDMKLSGENVVPFVEDEN
jgi:hypothetical protein